MPADANTYAQMQKTYYDERARTEEDAKGLVHPDYELASTQAIPALSYVLLEYGSRSADKIEGDDFQTIATQLSTLPRNLAVLDFGCGVGRLMEPLARQGFRVDGTDISEQMLSFARKKPVLATSQFYLSSGTDCGGAPSGNYDIVYSCLCIQHIATRAVRNAIIASIADALRDGGMVSIQLHYYPDHSSLQVPAPHVPWAVDKFDAEGTNSDADVWVTPDQLHIVLEDFRKHFQDIRLQFIEFPQEAKLFTGAYGTRFEHVIVSGTKGYSLAGRLYP